MPFSVGDKVVHPHHGPGWIAGIEHRELLDGTKRYYVIEVPGQRLTVHIPVGKVDEVGAGPQVRLYLRVGGFGARGAALVAVILGDRHELADGGAVEEVDDHAPGEVGSQLEDRIAGGAPW